MAGLDTGANSAAVMDPAAVSGGAIVTDSIVVQLSQIMQLSLMVYYIPNTTALEDSEREHIFRFDLTTEEKLDVKI